MQLKDTNNFKALDGCCQIVSQQGYPVFYVGICFLTPFIALNVTLITDVTQKHSTL